MQTLSTNFDLELHGAELVKRLGGHWQHGGGMCHCPAHDDHSPSLSVRAGTFALLFKCFAGCDTRAVIRAIAKVDRASLGRRPGKAIDQEMGLQPRGRCEPGLRIWNSSSPLHGSLAARYLHSRCLLLLPPALRFHPRTPLGRGRAAIFRPAMIAALQEGGTLVAIQRTFLDLDGSLAPDLDNSRRMLGRPMGGAVVLAPATERLGLAEGIETALSAMMLFSIPVWATLGNERLHQIAVPDNVSHLFLLPDNDRGGRLGAARAATALQRDGRLVETIWPPAGFNDWNDVLRHGGDSIRMERGYLMARSLAPGDLDQGTRNNPRRPWRIPAPGPLRGEQGCNLDPASRAGEQWRSP
jgi:putative DNA primase/helicase